MTYYVYILFSSSMDKYYVGYSQDVDQRLIEHLKNHKGFSGKVKDWTIVYKEIYPSKSDAYARERYIKRQKSRIFIENLIKKGA